MGNQSFNHHSIPGDVIMAAKTKKKLTPEQEFEMMKLVLNKILWIGVVVILYGGYQMAVKADVLDSLLFMAAGVIIFIIFIAMLVKDYEWARRS